jgi:hypothetical protein
MRQVVIETGIRFNWAQCEDIELGCVMYDTEYF